MTHGTVLHTVRKKWIWHPFFLHCVQADNWKSRYLVRIRWMSWSTSGFTVIIVIEDLCLTWLAQNSYAGYNHFTSRKWPYDILRGFKIYHLYNVWYLYSLSFLQLHKYKVFKVSLSYWRRCYFQLYIHLRGISSNIFLPHKVGRLASSLWWLANA